MVIRFTYNIICDAQFYKIVENIESYFIRFFFLSKAFFLNRIRHLVSNVHEKRTTFLKLKTHFFSFFVGFHHHIFTKHCFLCLGVSYKKVYSERRNKFLKGRTLSIPMVILFSPRTLYLL